MENQGFQCDICSEIIKMVQNLKRHYCNKHHLSREEASQRTEGLKENKTVCPQCNKSIIRVDKHVCPKEQFSPPKGQRAAKKQNRGYVLPSTSGACALPSSSVMRESPSTAMFELSLSGNEANRTGSRPPAPSETFVRQAMIPEIIGKFEDYIVQPSAGGGSQRTAENYGGYMKAFLKFVVEQEGYGLDAARKIYNVSLNGDYLPLPHIGDWVESAYPSEQDNTASRLGSFNAYIKFAEFLKFQLQNNRVQFQNNQSEYAWRMDHIQIQKEAVKKLNKNLSARSIVLKEQRALETRVHDGKKPAIPFDVMKRITDDYIDCPERSRTFNLLSDSINNFKKHKYLSSEARLRNWLMLEYYIHGAGKRPDAVYNLKWSQLRNGIKEGEDSYVIEIREGKTFNKYGSMKVHLPSSIRNLLINYCQEVYPNFKRLQRKAAKTKEEYEKHSRIQDDDYVFLSEMGDKMTRITEIMPVWKWFVPESFDKWNPTPIDFRRFCATQYQSSEDQLTRENAPLDMGHSQATARATYEQRSKKTERSIEMKKEIIPFDRISSAASNTIAVSEKAADMIRKQKEAAKEEKRRKEEARDEAKFVRTERKKLLPSEIRCLRATFDHLGRNTLLAKDIDAALKTEEFARMFNDIKMRENQFRVQNDSDIKVLLQNAYRASKRGEQK